MHEHRRRAPALRRTAGLVGLFTVSVALALPVYLRGLVPLDEGALAHVADRLARGEVLYRDVATGLMPGAYYVLALLYRLFGPSLEIGRILQALVLGAGACLVLVLASRFAPRRAAWAAAVVFVAVELFAYRYPNYSPPAVLLILLAVVLLAEHLETGGRLPAALGSGLVLGLSLLFKQNYATFVALGLGLVLLRRLLVDPRRITALAVAGFAAGFVVPLSLVVLALALAGALGPFLDYSVFALLSETLSSFYKPYPVLDLSDPLFFRRDLFNYLPFPPLVEAVAAADLPPRHWLFASSIVAVFLAPPAILVAAVIVLLRDLRRRRLADSELALVVAAVALFAGVFPRSDYHHLALVLPLSLATAAWLWGRLDPSLPGSLRWAAGVLTGLFALASAVPPFLPIFLPLPERLDTPLRVPRAEHIRVSTSEASRVRTVLSWLAMHTRAEDPLLVVPNDPWVYFLAGLRNPSPYPLALPGSFDEDRLLDALVQVEVVVARDAAYDATPVASLFPRLARRLRAEFVPDREYLRRLSHPSSEPLQVLVRRTGDSARGARKRALDLLRATGSARTSIVTFDGSERRRSEAEIPRLLVRPWLQTPSLFLRPPSGWQKLLVEIPVRLAGATSLELRLALRPTPRDEGDGAWLETFVYSPGRDRVTRLGVEWLHPAAEDSWLGVPVTYTLEAAEPGPAVLVFAAASGPRLDEEGDELLVMGPHLVSASGAAAAEVGVPARLSDDARRRMAAFTDTSVFERASAADPDDARVLGNLGTVHARQGRLAEARRALGSAVRRAPADAELRLAHAELLLASGDGDGALAAYEALLNLAPEHPRALAKSAELLGEEASRLDVALRRARRAVRLDPRDGAARLALGRVHMASGASDLATEQFLVALELVVDREPVLAMLNRHAPWGRLEGPDGPLTRASGPLREAAYSGRVEAAEAPPRTVDAGGRLPLDLRLVNPTDTAWPALGEPDGRHRVVLEHRFTSLAPEANVECEQTHLLAADLGPGSTRLVHLSLPVPERPGTYRLVVDLVQEGVSRFGERGGEAYSVRLEVR